MKPHPTIGIPTQAAEVGKEFGLDDVDPVGRSEVLIYSAPGNGKTVTAATFPPPFRWLAADGMTSLKSVRWAVQMGMTSIKDLKTDLRAYSPLEDTERGYASKPIAFDRAADMIQHWFMQIDQWRGGTLVIDSATTIDEWALNKGLDLNAGNPTREKPLSKSHIINQKVKARIITGEQDYKSSMGLFQGFINEVRVDCANHGVNLVLLCHEYTETDEAGNIIRYMPLLTGQLRTRISKDFDDIWYLEKLIGVKGPEVVLMPHGDPRHIGKTRWGNALGSSEKPDFRELVAKVKKFYGV